MNLIMKVRVCLLISYFLTVTTGFTVGDNVRLSSHNDRIHHQQSKIQGRSLTSRNRGSRLNAASTFGTAVQSFYKNSPYLAAFITCGLKASAADLVAQSGEKRGLNGRRNLAFILYGGAYQGVFQEHMYNHIFPILFGYGTNTLTVASKVLFDILLLNPLLCLPCAYLSKGAIFGYSPKEAIRRYINDIRQYGLLIKSWCIWVPVQCITFSIIPEYLRISFIAAVSFFWLIILSSVSARREKLVKT